MFCQYVIRHLSKHYKVKVYQNLYNRFFQNYFVNITTIISNNYNSILLTFAKFYSHSRFKLSLNRSLLVLIESLSGTLSNLEKVTQTLKVQIELIKFAQCC